jgi:hypothetical protein
MENHFGGGEAIPPVSPGLLFIRDIASQIGQAADR